MGFLAVPFTKGVIDSLSKVDPVEIEQRVDAAIVTDLVERLSSSGDTNAAHALHLLESEGLIEVSVHGGPYSISDVSGFMEYLKACVQNPTLTADGTPVGVSGVIGAIGAWYIGQVMAEQGKDATPYRADLPALPENPNRSQIWNTEFTFTPKEDPFAAIIPEELQDMMGLSMEDEYIWPTTGTVTSIYGRRWGRQHGGVDIGAPVGTPVVTVADGVVDYVGWDPEGYGKFVDIVHSDGRITRYAHNDSITVTLGQRVSQGQKIAEMGNTGSSTGPHLHFEIFEANGERINPNSVLPDPSGFGVIIPRGYVFNGDTLAWDFSVYKNK